MHVALASASCPQSSAPPRPGSSGLEQYQRLISFYGRIIPHCMKTCPFVSPVLCRQTFGWFAPFGCWERLCRRPHVDLCPIAPGSAPKGGVRGSTPNLRSTLNLLRSCPAIVRSCCAVLRSFSPSVRGRFPQLLPYKCYSLGP